MAIIVSCFVSRFVSRWCSVGLACFSLAGCSEDADPQIRIQDEERDPAVDRIFDVNELPRLLGDVADAVVRINFPLQLMGTGFFISGDGYLLTNSHVGGLDQCPVECEAMVTLRGLESGRVRERSVGARLILADEALDIALLRVDPPAGAAFAWVDIANHTPPEVGDELHVIGHPYGGLKKGQLTWAEGEMAGRLTTADSLYPGSSGSPVVTQDGVLMGVVYASAGLGLAVPIDQIVAKYGFLTALSGQTADPATEAELGTLVPFSAQPAPVDAVIEELEAYLLGDNATATVVDMLDFATMIANGPACPDGDRDPLDLLLRMLEVAGDPLIHEPHVHLWAARPATVLAIRAHKQGCFSQADAEELIVELLALFDRLAAFGSDPGPVIGLVDELSWAVGTHDRYRDWIADYLSGSDDAHRLGLRLALGATGTPHQTLETLHELDDRQLHSPSLPYELLRALRHYPAHAESVGELAERIRDTAFNLTSILPAERVVDEVGEDQLFDGE